MDTFTYFIHKIADTNFSFIQNAANYIQCSLESKAFIEPNFSSGSDTRQRGTLTETFPSASGTLFSGEIVHQ